ncbi:MAG: hypothetical protein ACOYL5_18245 [Phototrophicaceae bacterium]
MDNTKLNFGRESVVGENSIQSLILTAYLDPDQQQELLTTFCRNGEWLVVIPSESGRVELTSAQFAEIFHQFNLFMIQQNRSLLQADQALNQAGD